MENEKEEPHVEQPAPFPEKKPWLEDMVSIMLSATIFAVAVVLAFW
jgi:hypothetical protein